MIPFVVPFGLFVALALLRRAAVLPERYSVAEIAAWSLAALLLLSGTAHFSSWRDDFIRMVPPSFPRPDLLVAITGVLELLGAVGLLLRPTRTLAGLGLALLFVAMLPANIHATRAGVTLGGHPMPPLWLRIPEQVAYIAMALAPAWHARRR